MSKPRPKTVAVVAAAEQTILSKEQLAFNTLIQKIEKKRVNLSRWEVAIFGYQQKYNSKLFPLQEELIELQISLLHALDRAFDQKGLSKNDRGEISRMICDVAWHLLDGRDDPELKAVFNKHSGCDYDSEESSNLEHMKTMFEGMLGVELGDDLNLDSPEALQQHFEAQMEEEWEREKAEFEKSDALRSKRKKSAKQLAKEAEEQAEEQQASLSIREVYRKLASALHPDRETNSAERERKTALMQRVNEAYENRNLLQLLKLQLELEHIDQTSVNNISEARLKHYNKILKDQLRELELEIHYVKNGFLMQFDIRHLPRVSPSSIMRSLDDNIDETRYAISDIQKNVLAFTDVKKVKAWLKSVKAQISAQDDYGDCPF